jgi:AAA domain
MPATATPPKIITSEALKRMGFQTIPTTEQLKAKFKLLAKEHHPDKGGDTRTFQAIKDAHDYLKRFARSDSTTKATTQAPPKPDTPAKPKPKRPRGKLNEQQEQVAGEILEWLRNPWKDKNKVLKGAAGVGKTHMIREVIQRAIDEGLMTELDIIGCAPTHPATKILRNSVGDLVLALRTCHATLNLRPKKTKFTNADRQRKQYLIDLGEEGRTAKERNELELLQHQEKAAAERKKEFVPSGPLRSLNNIRLVIVDEAGMLNELMVLLYLNAAYAPGRGVKLHPDLQILYMGDPAQLAPIGEKTSKIFDFPTFTELTDIVRYDGLLKKYCTIMREYALGIRTGDGYKTLHYDIAAQAKDDDECNFMIMDSADILNRETLKQLFDGTTVRFLAGRNHRVKFLNDEISYLLKSEPTEPAQTIAPTTAKVNPFHIAKVTPPKRSVSFGTGDIILTTDSISRTAKTYGPSCDDSGVIEVHTSTLLELTEQLGIGDVIQIEAGDEYSPATTLVTTQDMYSVIGPSGRTFNRKLFRYTLGDDDDEGVKHRAIALVNPEDYAAWMEDCKTLRDWAMTSISSGKKLETSRGKNTGLVAETVWPEYGLKNWFKKLDGTVLDDVEYDKIRGALWRNYYNLLGFGDPAGFAFASTTHRAQGSSIQIVVIDMTDILQPIASWRKDDETWSIVKLLYTATTRGMMQVIIMV